MEHTARTATHYVEQIHAEAPAQENSKAENIKQTASLPTQALQSRLIISQELWINNFETFWSYKL